MMPVILAVHFPAKKLAKLRMAAMRLGAKEIGRASCRERV